MSFSWAFIAISAFMALKDNRLPFVVFRHKNKVEISEGKSYKTRNSCKVKKYIIWYYLLFIQ